MTFQSCSERFSLTLAGLKLGHGGHSLTIELSGGGGCCSCRKRERLVYLNEAFQVRLFARLHVSHVLRA